MVPGLQRGDDARRDLADQRVRNSEDDDLRAVERRLGRDAVEAEAGLQALAAGVADLDMADLEARALEVLREAVAHLAAGAEKRDRRHCCPPWRRRIS